MDKNFWADLLFFARSLACRDLAAEGAMAHAIDLWNRALRPREWRRAMALVHKAACRWYFASCSELANIAIADASPADPSPALLRSAARVAVGMGDIRL